MKLLILSTLIASVLSLPAVPIPIAAPLNIGIHSLPSAPAVVTSSQTPSSLLPTPTLAAATSAQPASADEAPLPTEKPELKARQTIVGGGGGYTITGSGSGWGWPPGGGEVFTFTIPGGKVITLTAPPLSLTLGPWP